MPAYHVGDRVWVPLAAGKVVGFIAEDQGPIGMKGRRLFRVAVPIDPDEPMSFVMAEAEIEQISGPTEIDRELDPDEVDDYLTNGGLILMLQFEDPEAKSRPRVWLCRDTHFNVTHTFYEERGRLGGAAIPGMASQWSRIYAPKRDEVLRFLATFGLDPARAEKVANAVGISPRPKREMSRSGQPEGVSE